MEEWNVIMRRKKIVELIGSSPTPHDEVCGKLAMLVFDLLVEAPEEGRLILDLSTLLTKLNPNWRTVYGIDEKELAQQD